MNSEYEIVRPESLVNFCRDVFGRLEVSLPDARTVAEVLVAADLRGIDSHGVARLRRYVRGLKEGIMLPNPGLKIVYETPLSALLGRHVPGNAFFPRGAWHSKSGVPKGTGGSNPSLSANT